MASEYEGKLPVWCLYLAVSMGRFSYGDCALMLRNSPVSFLSSKALVAATVPHFSSLLIGLALPIRENATAHLMVHPIILLSNSHPAPKSTFQFSQSPKCATPPRISG